MVTITCDHPGCQRSQTVRRSRVTACDGYMCGQQHGPPDEPAPGLVREIVFEAAGGFAGWRDIVPDKEQQDAVARAHRLALFAQARTIPREQVISLLKALVLPAGPELDHVLTIGELSTGLSVAADGSLEIELPHVAAALRLLLDQRQTCGVILRTFTGESAADDLDGGTLPIKEVRGWRLEQGTLHPVSETEIRAAHSTHAEPGRPTASEQGVRYRDAWPIKLST